MCGCRNERRSEIEFKTSKISLRLIQTTITGQKRRRSSASTNRQKSSTKLCSYNGAYKRERESQPTANRKPKTWNLVWPFNGIIQLKGINVIIFPKTTDVGCRRCWFKRFIVVGWLFSFWLKDCRWRNLLKSQKRCLLKWSSQVFFGGLFVRSIQHGEEC